MGYFKLSKEEAAVFQESGIYNPPKGMYPDTQTIHDARALQATYESPGAFFKEFGFCLLQHKSNVKEWCTDFMSTDNDITKFYHSEIDDLLRNQIYKDDYDKILDLF